MNKLPKLSKKNFKNIISYVLIGGILLWSLVINPLLTWIQNNLFLFASILIIILLLIGGIIYFIFKNKIEQKKELIHNLESEKARQIDAILIEHKMEWLARGINEVDMRKLAEQKLLSPNDPNLRPSVVTLDPEFEAILMSIDTDYRKIISGQKIDSEQAFQHDLTTYLQTKYNTLYTINKEENVSLGRADIVIKKFGKLFILELKYANNQNTLIKGEDEINTYKKQCQGLAMLLYYPKEGISEAKLNQFVEKYHDMGVKVLIFNK